MGKQIKWTLEQKVKIVKEFKKDDTISYLMKKYGIPSWRTVSRWNQEYDERILSVDNRGKRKSQQEIEDIDILKKYVHWYNNERIQKSLGYLSPVQYRLKYSN